MSFFRRLRNHLKEFIDEFFFSSDTLFSNIRVIIFLFVLLPFLLMVFHVSIFRCFIFGITPTFVSFWMSYIFISGKKDFTLFHASYNPTNKKRRRNPFNKIKFQYDLQVNDKRKKYVKPVKVNNRTFWKVVVWEYDQLSKFFFFFLNPVLSLQMWMLWSLSNSEHFLLKFYLTLLYFFGSFLFFIVFVRSENNRDGERMIFNEGAFLEGRIAEVWEDSRLDAEKDVFKDFFRKNDKPVGMGDFAYKNHLNESLNEKLNESMHSRRNRRSGNTNTSTTSDDDDQPHMKKEFNFEYVI